MSELVCKAVAGVLAVLVLVLVCVSLQVAGQRNEARRARDLAVATVGVLAADLSTCRGNAVALQFAVSEQGAATKRAAAQAATEQAEGQRQLRLVEADNRELLSRVGVLRGILARSAPATCQEGWDAFSSTVGGR